MAVANDNYTFTNELRAGDVPDIFANIMRNYGMRFECCIPAVVVAYERLTNVVAVQPAINRIDIDGKSIPRMPIELTCWNPCGGGIGINFPLLPGDTGHIIACDRDSTFFKQFLAPMNPQTGDLHKYAHGFFLPDKIKGIVVSPEDAGALVIQSLTGDTKISIGIGKITLLSQTTGTPTKITITPAGVVLTTAGKVEATATGGVDITGDITITGKINATGDITTVGAIAATGAVSVVGSVSTTGDVTAGSVSLKGHIHPFGGQTTGAPVQ